jgi:two-component system sensor histidine kinase VanS
LAIKLKTTEDKRSRAVNSLKENGFQSRLTALLFRRYLLAVTVFTMLLIVLFLFMYYAGHNWITWYDPWSSLYVTLKYLERMKLYAFLLFWFSGFLIITLYYWRKAINYTTEIIGSIERLYDSDTELVRLPGELNEVEDRLNRIKFDSIKSQQLAKEAEQRKNDLVVYLAHDLKTPLTSVIGYLTLLRDERQISPELREKYLSVAVNKSQRLEALINEFFEITRFNLTGLTLELSKVNLNRMLAQITDEFKPLMLPKNLTCILETDEEISLRCDAAKLERVFDNLLRNSINYNYENSTIQVTARKTGNKVELMFRNQGDTIPEYKLDHIFEQFYRLDTARSTQTGGAGLGLAIAKEIVELHGGSISAASINDVVEFTILLPLSNVGKS